jgi:hypothetical protein
LIALLIRRVRKISKGDYQLRHVRLSIRPSVHMEQHGCHWTEFDGI